MWLQLLGTTLIISIIEPAVSVANFNLPLPKCKIYQLTAKLVPASRRLSVGCLFFAGDDVF